MTLILADTSVWIEHLRTGSDALKGALQDGLVLSHPMVVGELALGNLARRTELIPSLKALPGAVLAGDEEVLSSVDRYGLPGRGIGYVDAHLLVSTRLTPSARLWTRDRRLAAIARESGIEFTARA
jgi:predicted nucleic acid-binding protein